jgi:3-hydroxyethyl bacteriochlorophyllide a dehydrogenase
MQTTAVIFEQPEHIGLKSLNVTDPGAGDVIVEAIWSGISAGTEKLLFEGRMPQFPGMGYPLVPGYETVGRVISAGRDCSSDLEGQLVFVPGARGYQDAAALFGASASRLVAAADRVIPIGDDLARDGRCFHWRPPPITRFPCRAWPRRTWSSATASSAVSPPG